MTGVQIAALALVAIGASVVALVRDPLRQALSFSVFGTALAILFFAFQAPDVALTQVVVSAVGLPVIVILVLTKLAEEKEEQEEGEE